MTFTWIPDYSASAEEAPNVNSIKFGDGYEQRQANGINNDPLTWNVSFSNRDTSEGTAILTFLRSHGGVDTFDWTPPYESSPIQVVCKTWNRSFPAFDVVSITAKFEQRFES